jgi:hypothetical protein
MRLRAFDAAAMPDAAKPAAVAHTFIAAAEDAADVCLSLLI